MTYSSQYDNDVIRNAAYSVITHITPYLAPDEQVLDFGCGTCKKTIAMAEKVRCVVGIDYNVTMVSKARENIARSRCDNVMVLESDNTASPFPPGSFDLCTAFLTTYSPAEAHRVLKLGGRFIIEILDADDKEAFKQQFGVDRFGWRGRFLNQTCEERRRYVTASLSPFFDIETLIPIEFETVLTIPGAIHMLQETPTIRGFDAEEDAEVLNRLAENGKVTFVEKRLIIVAKRHDIVGFS